MRRARPGGVPPLADRGAARAGARRRRHAPEADRRLDGFERRPHNQRERAKNQQQERPSRRSHQRGHERNGHPDVEDYAETIDELGGSGQIELRDHSYLFEPSHPFPLPSGQSSPATSSARPFPNLRKASSSSSCSQLVPASESLIAAACRIDWRGSTLPTP